MRNLMLVVCGMLAACASVDETREQELRRAPATVVIAVKAPDLAEPSADVDGVAMRASGEAMRDSLIERLRRVGAASHVVPFESAARDEYDVVLAPLMTSAPPMRHVGYFEGPWLASTGLWLVTWVGGLVVEDAQYQVDGDFRFDLTYGSGSTSVPGVASVSVDPVRTTFFERNDFFSWPTLQSVIIPPFLTSDQQESTNDALTEKVLADVGDSLAIYFKSQFEDASLSSGLPVRVDVAPGVPQNGAMVDGESVDLALVVRAKRPISAAEWRLLPDGELVSLDAQKGEAGLDYQDWIVRGTVRGLAEGTNLVRVEFDLDGDIVQRTLRYERRPGRMATGQ